MGQDPNQPYPGQYGQPQPGGVPPQSGYQQQGAYQPPNPEYQQPGAYPPPNTGYQQPNAGYQYQQPYGQPQAQGMYNTGNPLGPTTLNMEPNTAAGLSYLTVIGGLIVFLMEKQNRFVRFHAMQSIILCIAFFVVEIILDVLSVSLAFTAIGCIFIPFLSLIGLAGFVLWLICIINAFQGKYFKLPVIGDMAERWANSGRPAM